MTLENQPKHIQNEYYVEEDYSKLAGPYDTSIKRHNRYLAAVVEDMERGYIDYRIVEDEMGRKYVERKGMILPKR